LQGFLLSFIVFPHRIRDRIGDEVEVAVAISTPVETRQSVYDPGLERRTRRNVDFSDLKSMLGSFSKETKLSSALRQMLSYLHETKRVCDADFAMPADPCLSAFCYALLFVPPHYTRRVESS